MIRGWFDTPFLALVRREFLVNLRTTRAFFLITVAVLLFIIPTAALFPEDMMDARNSNDIHYMLIGFLFVVAALVVPGLSAASVSVEREAETFELLMMSTVSPSGVLIAKLLNAIGFFLLIIVAALPVLSTVLFLPGVEISVLLYSFVILFIYTITLACHGIMCSVIFRRTYTAMMASYGAMILVSGGALFVVYMVFAMVVFIAQGITGDYSMMRELGHSLELSGPIIAPVLGLVDSDLTDEVEYFLDKYGLIQFIPMFIRPFLAVFLQVCYQVGCASIAFWVAKRYLPRDVHPRAESKEKIIDDSAELDKRRKRFPFYLIDPAKRKKLIEDGRNPIMVKEMRWGALSNLSVYIRVFYLTLLLFGGLNVVLWFNGITDIAEELAITYVLQTTLSCCVAPALMANTLTKEIETGNLDLLRSTLLDSNSIVRGKWAACVLAACPVTLSALICNMPFMFSINVWRVHGDILITGTILLILSTVFVMNIAFFTSSFAKSTAMAIVSGYAAALFVMVIGPGVLTFGLLFYSSSFTDVLLLLTTFMSPPISYLISIEEYRFYRHYRTVETNEMYFYVYWFVSMLYLAGASALLFIRTQRQFAKRMAEGEH